MTVSKVLSEACSNNITSENHEMSQRLGDILVAEKLLTHDQLEEVIETQCLYGGRLGTNIVELGFLSEEEIARTLSRKLCLPYIEPKQLMKIPAEVISIVPQRLAWKHQVVPCRLEKKRLYLAMADPTNLSTIDALAFRLGFIIVPVVVPEIRLMLALQEFYQFELSIRFQRLSHNPAATNHMMLEQRSPQKKQEEPILELADEDILDHSPADVKTKPLRNEKDLRERPSEQPDQALLNLSENLCSSAEDTQNHPESQSQATLEVQKLHSKELQPFGIFCKQLNSAEKRDDIADAVIEYFASLNGGVALMMVKNGEAIGWKAAYAAKPLPNFELLQIPLNQPSILQTVVENKTYYLGPLPKEFNNILLSSRFSHQPPQEVLLIPLMLRGRLVSLLYLHDIDENIHEQLPEYQKLSSKVTMAFEMLIIKNKIQIG